MNTSRSASALATRPTSSSRPRRSPVEQPPVGSAIHVRDWDKSTNVSSKRVHKRTPEEARIHADARATAANERHQRLAKMTPSHPLKHPSTWNGSTNVNSKRVNKRSSDQAVLLEVARTAAANERRERMAKLASSRPLKHSSPWNGSTNVHSKAVVRQAATTRSDVKQVAQPCDRRATLPVPRPFVPVFPWDASTNLASKRVNLPFQRRSSTRGADHRARRSSATQPMTQSAPRRSAKSHEAKSPPLYIPPTYSKARVLVRAA